MMHSRTVSVSRNSCCLFFSLQMLRKDQLVLIMQQQQQLWLDHGADKEWRGERHLAVADRLTTSANKSEGCRVNCPQISSIEMISFNRYGGKKYTRHQYCAQTDTRWCHRTSCPFESFLFVCFCLVCFIWKCSALHVAHDDKIICKIKARRRHPKTIIDMLMTTTTQLISAVCHWHNVWIYQDT